MSGTIKRIFAKEVICELHLKVEKEIFSSDGDGAILGLTQPSASLSVTARAR